MKIGQATLALVLGVLVAGCPSGTGVRTDGADAGDGAIAGSAGGGGGPSGGGNGGAPGGSAGSALPNDAGSATRDAEGEVQPSQTDGLPGDAGLATRDAEGDVQPSQTDGGAANCFPPCLTDLGLACPRLGEACVSATAANGDRSTCYANGVKTLATAAATTVKKADGDVCFKINAAAGGKDYATASGAVAAHLADTAMSDHYVVTCADGTITDVDLTSPQCAATVAAMLTCTAGPCSY